MKLLAVDCAANLCSACVLDVTADREIGRSVADIGKGHAERLMTAIAEALQAADADYGDLDRLAVSVGPGSFTGVRVAVSAIRGLALALGLEATGVTTLDAIAAQAMTAFPDRPVMVALMPGGTIFMLRSTIHRAR